MSLVEQDLCFYIEENPSIPFAVSISPGIDAAVDLTGATVMHTVKSSDLGTVRFSSAITIIEDPAPVSPVLLKGTIDITAAQLASAGSGRHKHGLKLTTADGRVHVIIPPSEFLIKDC